MEPTAEQYDLCQRYIDMIMDINQSLNLTRITSKEQAQVLHLEDSLAGLPYILKAPEGRYADIGTGGGFPGIPLAICTGRETLLVDSVQKKMMALDSVIKKLKLVNISTYAGRIEELSLAQPKSFSVITARALTVLPSLLELASPLLKQGGQLICYKSRSVDDELELAKNLSGKLAMYLVSDNRFTLSDGETERCILVYEKHGEPTVKLPRRIGMAQKRPYK